MDLNRGKCYAQSATRFGIGINNDGVFESKKYINDLIQNYQTNAIETNKKKTEE